MSRKGRFVQRNRAHGRNPGGRDGADIETTARRYALLQCASSAVKGFTGGQGAVSLCGEPRRVNVGTYAAALPGRERLAGALAGRLWALGLVPSRMEPARGVRAVRSWRAGFAALASLCSATAMYLSLMS